jgi:arylsulfatase A-like enzyme
LQSLRSSWSSGVILLLVLAGAAAWFAFRRPDVRTPAGQAIGPLPRGVAPSDLNLLLVTLDTTRADRLGAYGFQHVETPTFDRLAREGVLFEHAAAPAPLTLPAHASILTGTLPPAHGVRDNGGFILEDNQTTLAELVKVSGRKTGAFVGAYVLDSQWGLDQGFDTYNDDFNLADRQWLSLSGIERPANDVADKALEWLGGLAASRFFAWVHFYDAHSPYAPPEPYRTRYGDRRYAGELAFVDSQLARLIRWLADHRLLEKTLIVVIGDHGESLGDHGEGTHGFFIYESVLHVPFVIRAPYDTLRNRRVTDVVRSIV